MALGREDWSRIEMMISFVIPAHNEEHYLGRTLESLIGSAEAIDETYEVIVVADGCTDKTAAVARAHGVRVLEVDLRHIAGVRNVGAQHSTGELLVFVDADTLVPERTLRASVQAVQQGAIGGGARAVIDPRMPWMAHLIIRPLVCVFFRSLRFTLGGYLFVTRAGFEAVGGYDERYFAAEDAAICRSLRKHGRFVVLREPMITSGRKVDEMSTWQGMAMIGQLLLRGPKVFRRREGLEIWYDQRQSEPGPGEQ